MTWTLRWGRVSHRNRTNGARPPFDTFFATLLTPIGNFYVCGNFADQPVNARA